MKKRRKREKHGTKIESLKLKIAGVLKDNSVKKKKITYYEEDYGRKT